MCLKDSCRPWRKGGEAAGAVGGTALGARLRQWASPAGGREPQKGSESVEKENGAGGRVPPEARKGNSSGKDGGDLIEPHQKQRGQWTKELLKE